MYVITNPNLRLVVNPYIIYHTGYVLYWNRRTSNKPIYNYAERLQPALGVIIPLPSKCYDKTTQTPANTAKTLLFSNSWHYGTYMQALPNVNVLMHQLMKRARKPAIQRAKLPIKNP